LRAAFEDGFGPGAGPASVGSRVVVVGDLGAFPVSPPVGFAIFQLFSVEVANLSGNPARESGGNVTSVDLTPSPAVYSFSSFSSSSSLGGLVRLG